MRATREASQPDLVASTRRHLAAMLEHGATTVEVKSGYGLDAETEQLMLRAIQEAGYESAAHVVATCLAAHAVPEDAESADAYIELCIDEILPEVAEWGLAEAADVFCERGAFDVEQSRRYLEAAREHGLALRLHGDQFAEIGALELRSSRGALGRPPRGDRREAREARRSDVVGVVAADGGADARASAAAARALSTPAGCWRSRPTSIPDRVRATRCLRSCTWPARSAISRPPRRSRR